MSLFRSLQNSPSTVSIFHNQAIPLSNKLYDILQKAYETQPEKAKHEFQIDVMKDKMPTYDQYKLITSKYVKNATDKSILHDCFPFCMIRMLNCIIVKVIQLPLKVLNGTTRSSLHPSTL